MQTVLDKAQDDLEKAQEAVRELDLSSSVAVRPQTIAEGEQDQLKVERDRLKVEFGQLKALVEGFRASPDLECGPLSESGVLALGIQQWLLRIGQGQPPGWWSARSYRTSQLFLEHFPHL